MRYTWRENRVLTVIHRATRCKQSYTIKQKNKTKIDWCYGSGAILKRFCFSRSESLGRVTNSVPEEFAVLCLYRYAFEFGDNSRNILFVTPRRQNTSPILSEVQSHSPYCSGLNAVVKVGVQ